jgi:hypothetical protein
MPRQSTRGKLRSHLNRAGKALDKVLDHLQSLDVEADGKHPVVLEHIPISTIMIVALKQYLEKFRQAI